MLKGTVRGYVQAYLESKHLRILDNVIFPNFA
jgi:hypothetical protein